MRKITLLLTIIAFASFAFAQKGFVPKRLDKTNSSDYHVVMLKKMPVILFGKPDLQKPTGALQITAANQHPKMHLMDGLLAISATRAFSGNGQIRGHGVLLHRLQDVILQQVV